MNWGMEVLQTSALPLGYDAIFIFRKIKALNYSGFSALSGAEYEARTRYLNLGKVALYQMS